MTTTIQLKRGISTDWTTNNPVLAAGEVGIETDTNKIKIGNGSTAWTSLEYFSGNSGSGVSDYDLLSNQPQINSVTLTGNKTLANLGIMSDANFLPDGYTITLKADGTGDFATIQDAINFLNGKWSNGTVSIELAAGTYNITSHLLIGNTNGTLPNNIACLRITGADVDSTIINCTNSNEYTCIEMQNGYTFIRQLTIKNATKTLNNALLTFRGQASGQVSTVKLQNGEFGIQAYSTFGAARLYNCTIDNTTYAIYAGEGARINLANSVQTISNCVTALRVWSGGQINIGYATKNFTNVTNETNQTIGIITTDGMILGRWQN